MLSARDRAETLRAFESIAREAGDVLMKGYRTATGPRVEYKGAVDLVTDFDRASEALIRERLAVLLPGFDVVAEESGGVPSGTRPVVYADPLDGTTNFAHGHPFFAVSIGLVDDGVPVVGVVVAPALGWTFTGATVDRAARDATVCRTSAVDTLQRALVATGFPYDTATSPVNNLRTFTELQKRVQGIRRCGAAALDLCLVADGTYDGYWERKLKPWDLAAGVAIVEAAGGRVTGFDGARVDVTSGNVVASNGPLHDTLLRALDDASRMEPL